MNHVYLNEVMLAGTIHEDPVFRIETNGNEYCQVFLKTEIDITDNNSGEVTKQTHWHRIKLTGPKAASGHLELTVGTNALFWGRNTTKKYTDAKGSEHLIQEVESNRYQILAAAAIAPKKATDNTTSTNRVNLGSLQEDEQSCLATG